MWLYMLFTLFVVPVIETFKLHIKRYEYLLWYNFTDSKNEADEKQFIDNNNNDKKLHPGSLLFLVSKLYCCSSLVGY